jgi:hypothetical protein
MAILSGLTRSWSNDKAIPTAVRDLHSAKGMQLLAGLVTFLSILISLLYFFSYSECADFLGFETSCDAAADDNKDTNYECACKREVFEAAKRYAPNFQKGPMYDTTTFTCPASSVAGVVHVCQKPSKTSVSKVVWTGSFKVG